MGRVTGKDSRVLLPLSTDKFVRRKPAQGLQALGVVVGQQKGLQVLVELVGGLVVEALDGGFFDGAVHALNLAVGPRVRRLGQAVLHVVFPANAVKAVPTRQELVRLRRELHPIVGEHGMHFVRQLVEHASQKLGRDDAFGARMQLGKGHFAGAVDGHKKVLLAFFGLDLGEIDVQVADGVVLELLFRGALPLLVQRQATDAVALEAAVQRGAGQARNRGLQRVEAIVQGQQRVPTKGHGDGFLLGAEHRRHRLRAHARIGCGRTLAPLGHRFGVDAVARG